MPDEAPFKPLNPWGKSMPAYKGRESDYLYQVWAEAEDGPDFAISPKFAGPDGLKAAEQIAEAANTAIIRRQRPEWINAYIGRFAVN